MFARLGKLVTRHWLLVVVGWLAGAVALRLAAPAWDAIAHDGNMAYLPADMTSPRGERLLREAFPQQSAKSQMVIVVSRPDSALTNDDKTVALDLADQFLELADELAVEDVWTHDMRVIGEKLKSADGRAVLIALQMRTEFMAVENIQVLNRVAGIVDEMRHSEYFPAGLQLGITGSAAVGGDMLSSAAESIRNTEWTTVLVIMIILLAVYRAPLLVVVPLSAILVSIVVGSSLLALLTQLHRVPGMEWWDFKVFTTTRVFIVVILFGSGTDFCLFLIARYREELQGGLAQAQALTAALAGVGEALVGSAATTIVGLAMMFFADFGKFRDSGPAIAICLAVTLAACLTLAPALLHASRGYTFWPAALSGVAATQTAIGGESFPNAAGSRIWQRVGRAVVKQPGLLLVGSVALLTPLAVAGWSIDITYDLVNEMRSSRPSVAGSRLLREHFPAGETGPVTVLVERPDTNFRTTEGRDEASALTAHFLTLDGVTAVRSVTQPFGHPVGGLGSLLGGGAARVLAASTARAKDTYATPVEELQGSVARFDLVLAADPFSRDASELLDTIEHDVHQWQQDHPVWNNAAFFFTGTTAATRDLELVTQNDQTRIQRLVVIAVLAVLLVLLRQPAVCLYLIASVLFSYYVTLGATELFFGWVYGDTYTGLDWKVPLFLFVILIAVGEDYNIYLMTRVIEEQERHGPIRGLELAVARTGGIITSCGIIMAATFISMATGTLRGMQELGFALSLGVLLDTLVVRTVLVPAFLTLLDRVAWVRAARTQTAGR
jgi:RND superfamily putative drug exporter